MEKTRDRAVYVSAALGLWGISLTVSNPWLIGWLWISAVGSLVFAVKPQWASIRLWGSKKEELMTANPDDEGTVPNQGRRIGMDIERGTTRLRNTSIRNQDTSIRTKDTDLDVDDLDIK